MPSATTLNHPISRRSLLLGAAVFLQHHPNVVSYAGIGFSVLQHGPHRRSYLRIHGDEETARLALEAHLEKFDGKALIVTNKQRVIPILGGTLDPNRLFTREGAERNLRRLNPDWKPEQIAAALDLLDRERPKLIDALRPPTGGLLVAVHNNSRGYSVNDEVPISQKVHLPKAAEPHEFFLATTEADFAALAKGPYNAVLQSAPTGEEDGSLSRTALRLGIRYVNLEAASGKLAIQQEMLAFLESALPR